MGVWKNSAGPKGGPKGSGPFGRRGFIGLAGAVALGSVAGCQGLRGASVSTDPPAPPSTQLTHIETATYDGLHDDGRSSLAFALFGATAVNVPVVMYGLEWRGSVPEGSDLVLYPKRVRFAPRDGSTYTVEGVSLVPSDREEARIHQPTTVDGSRVSLTDLAGTIGCIVMLELWDDPATVEPGDAVDFGAVLEGVLAEGGGLPGRVVDEFTLETTATVTYRESPNSG